MRGVLGLLDRMLGRRQRVPARVPVAAHNPLERGLSRLQLEALSDWASRKRRFDRPTVVAMARYFESTSALANRLARIYVDYTVGPHGIICLPASSDAVWNGRVRDIWSELCEELVLGAPGQNGWASAQSYFVWRWFFDGELFLYLTAVDGRQRVQPLEPWRVKDPLPSPGGATIVDGVELNPTTQQPIAYHILVSQGNTVRIPAEQIIHIYDPSFVDQTRGLSVLEPVLTDLHCLQDLELYEMRAHADAAEKSTIWKLATGEFGLEDIRRGDLGLGEPAVPGGADLDQRVQAYSRALGGRAVAIGSNEDVVVVQPHRPTDEQRAFWDYLVNKVCIGVGIPRQIVSPFSVQGTVARADLSAARNSLLSTSEIFTRVVKRIYLWAIEQEMLRDGRLRAMAPPDWRKVSLRSPRQIDVDLGRSTAAMIEELKHGATHWEIVYGQMGLDWREELRKRAEQLAYMKNLADELGLDAAWLAQTMAARTEPGFPNQQETEENTDGTGTGD